MSRAGTMEASATELDANRLRVKTKVVCRVLSCDEKTLRNWEKVCPRLFCPVLRQKNGNIYRPKQVRIMADVMDGLMDADTGAELWERTLAVNADDIYRDAGDRSRGARK